MTQTLSGSTAPRNADRHSVESDFFTL